MGSLTWDCGGQPGTEWQYSRGMESANSIHILLNMLIEHKLRFTGHPTFRRFPMKRHVTAFSLIMILIAITGCASSLMQPVPKGPDSYKPAANEATVIFLRTSYFGGAIQASLFDVTTKDNLFIGIISAGTKLAFKTTPGKHMFMVVGENGDFMPGEFEGGKTYFAIVIPRMGLWKARFSLNPVHKNEMTSEFQKRRSSVNFVENTPKSEAWAKMHADSIQSKRDQDLPRWHGKADRDKIGLLLEDGE